MACSTNWPHRSIDVGVDVLLYGVAAPSTGKWRSSFIFFFRFFFFFFWRTPAVMGRSHQIITRVAEDWKKKWWNQQKKQTNKRRSQSISPAPVVIGVFKFSKKFGMNGKKNVHVEPLDNLDWILIKKKRLDCVFKGSSSTNEMQKKKREKNRWLQDSVKGFAAFLCLRLVFVGNGHKKKQKKKEKKTFG